ncbi:MAG TPA: glycosyltransferase family 4 protein [Gaiellaceae bacterium]|nr:glycosyltransferase family 4 protein [Gaiellaceae bacterium]
MSATTHLRRVGSPLRGLAIGLRTQVWPAHSRLFVAGDGNRWAIADDAAEVSRIAAGLGIDVGPEPWIARVRNQSVFHTSQFTLIGLPFERNGNRLGVAYLHGKPGTPGHPEFDTCYETVRRRHEELDRVQVSNRAMEALVLGTGIAPEKVFRIPIGVDTRRFRLRDAASRAEARRVLGLPESAFVAGSFQKDGVGWGEGLEPKLIKGPDVLLDVAERLQREVPELHVLLTGPARGFVAAGLARLRVPSTQVQLPDLDAVAQAYRAVDVCLVTSRDEGGPKAVLESMSTGVPLVTTEVGQASDLVRDCENGWLRPVDDAEGVADAAARVAHAPADELARVAAAARATAEGNSWTALRPRWSELFRGFVAMGQA